MNLRPGQTICEFESAKGKKIELKIPKYGWEAKYMDFINSVISEDDYIILSTKQTIENEEEFVESWIQKIKNKQGISLTAFHNDEIIGNCDLNFCQDDRRNHVAVFGITIKEGFREEKIGSKMMECLFSLAKESGIKIVKLDVFSTNKRAQRVYEKMGFTIVGKVPKGIFRRGKYIDDIIMVKELSTDD